MGIIGRRVRGGPFEGMRYLSESAGSTLMPKILGTYEREIWPTLQSVLSAAPGSTVIDVGAGEGYYVTGLLWSGRAKRVIAFEENQEARRMLSDLASKNGVAERVEIRGCCDAVSLSSALEESKPSLLIVDIEGSEVEVLSEDVARRAQYTTVVVEIHPWVNRDASSCIASRFGATHDASTISAREPAPLDIDSSVFRTLAHVHRQLANRLLQERPGGMSWLILRNRQNREPSVIPMGSLVVE